MSYVQESAGFGNKMAGISSALAFSIISDKTLYGIKNILLHSMWLVKC